MASRFSSFSAPFQRRDDSGFALPIAIGVGLLLLIVGAAIVLRSHQQQVTAIAQKQTASSLSAAEVGVSRIQNLLTRYRAASLYPACAIWEGNTCKDSGTTPITWKNASASAIPGLSTSCPKDSPATSERKVAEAATKVWQDIDKEDPAKGQYRLMEYSYSTSDGQGTLKVQGKAGTAAGSLSAVTQLSVTIPVQPVSPYVPGLWVQTSVNTGTIKANILGPCTGTITSPAAGFGIARSALEIPSPPSLPSSGVYYDLGSTLPKDVTLPRTGDIASATTGTYQTYKYVVESINNSFTITSGKKVELWVKGDIKLQDGQSILHPSCSTVSGCSPFDAKIYGLSSSGTLELNGKAAVCDIFFYAPTYNVEHKNEPTDTTKAAGCGGGVNNNSIYWVNSWSGGGQGVQVALDQANAVWSSQSVLKPLIVLKSITNWQREEADPP
jgi:hypothetical protein